MLLIGVHTPETDSEKVTANVEREVKKQGVTHPVVVDEKNENWARWKQQWWPSVYLIDRRGRVAYGWAGELEFQGAGGEAKMTAFIEELLREK